MKEQVRDMFSEITMPEETEQKVLAAVSRRRKKPQTPFVRSIATLAAVLALVILVSPTARAAVENWVVKYFFPGSDLTIYEQTDESGNVTGIVGVVDTEAPPFARMVNGRLYFLGNNEKIDITEEITEEKPYFYTYVDDYGLTHPWRWATAAPSKTMASMSSSGRKQAENGIGSLAPDEIS